MKNNCLENIFHYIKEDRCRVSTGGIRDILIASESDKGRIINSAPFRRLQQKAQVFPLETNAAVRTRLTHSIEVSQIGRYIAQKIIEKGIVDNNSYQQLAAFVNTVDTACLLHDIGNPPFGHLGEAAIKEWFKKNAKYHNDLIEFDGNPQGFRLISFLSGLDEFGYNLTCTQLLSTIKYPWDYEEKGDNNKIGLFTSNLEAYNKCCDLLKWKNGDKFPFVYLMDAADDIAFSMSDLEDGLEKKIISINDLQEEYGKSKFIASGIEPFVKFKTDIINEAVDVVSNNFLNNLDEIMNGNYDKLINERSEVGGLINNINNYAKKYIYSHEDAEKVELAGRSVIMGLLDHFKPLLDMNEKEFNYLVEEDNRQIKKLGLDFHIRLFRLLPKNYIKKYSISKQGDENIRRGHLLVDYISGMTDDFALETYQVLQGIKIK